MLARCRATVFSLRYSSFAIARLVWPAATSRTTSTSRAVSAPDGAAGPLVGAGGPPGPRGRGGGGGVPRGAEPLEALAGGLDLQVGRLRVAELPQAAAG